MIKSYKDIIFNSFKKIGSNITRTIEFKPILNIINTVRTIEFIPILKTITRTIEFIPTLTTAVRTIEFLPILSGITFDVKASILGIVSEYFEVQSTIVGIPLYDNYDVRATVYEYTTDLYNVQAKIYDYESCSDEFIELNC